MSHLTDSLPPPRPLQQGVLIHYQWGKQKFEIVAMACTICTLAWEETEEEFTWLHCKAVEMPVVKSDGSAIAMNVLIPAQYVTRAEPGPTFRITEPKKKGDLGIYPPNQPTPENPVPLAELERIIAGLLDPSLN